MIILLVITFLQIFATTYCEDNDGRPLVKTSFGEILGYQKFSSKGRIFSVFEGIPFAEPPIGELRFKDPVPLKAPWIGKWDARFTPQCLQATFQLDSSSGEEDCLYLNVYVPREKVNPEEKLDVIVHIHGGAFVWGSGHTYAHPEYLMDEDVIFVTFNYRLGMFGFLSTLDDEVPGNMGLKDQILALKWVQEHISNFGGNPESVTLTGLSAGGASVHLHYLSLLSKGLFNRGFSQSGVATNCWVIQDEPVKKAKLLADSVGCPVNESKKLVDCLRKRPANHIIARTPLFYGFNIAPYSPFAPVIEKESDTAFLYQNPYYLLAKGKIQDLPWISSNTADEGTFPALNLLKELNVIDKNWTKLAPHLLDFNYTLSRTLHSATAKDIRDFYFDEGEEINAGSFGKLMKMLGDRLFLVDAEKAARAQAKWNKEPVYSYYFNYTGESSYVRHGQDAQYLFYKMFGNKPTEDDLKMKDLMIGMLVAYAKTGKPTFGGAIWEPTTSNKFTFLNITGYEPEQINLQSVDEIAPKGFWKSLGFLESDNLVIIKDEL